MTNLSVVSRDGVNVVDSREVAEMVGKRHDHLLRDINGYVEILEKSIAPKIGLNEFFIPSTYQDSIGRKLPSYLLTKKGCDMVANKMTGEKGIIFTAIYVTKFDEMEKKLVQEFIAPKNYREALVFAIEQQDIIEKLESKIESDRPKVLFADSVSASSSTILIGELAKLIKQNGFDIGEKRLFKWLRENGYLISRQGTDYNTPTQKSQNLGLFKVKETVVNHSSGKITVSKTAKVTGKGQEYFINKFLNKDQSVAI